MALPTTLNHWINHWIHHAKTHEETTRSELRKLVPFLAAQDTFKAQAEAKYLADELEAKLAPAEVRTSAETFRLGEIIRFDMIRDV